jgi:long-subunit fatty acid transport protein
MAPENEGIHNNFGLGAGIGIGIDYYHSKKQFIHLGVSRNTGNSFQLFGSSEKYDSDYIFLSNNHKIKRFSIGYGVSFTNNTWEYKSEGWFFSSKKHLKKNHKAFGFIFPLTYQFTNNFNIGFVYRPTFYRPNMTDKFVYESLTSVGCVLKVRMKH